MRNLTIVLAVLATWAENLEAQEFRHVVLYAKPKVRVISSWEGSTWEELSQKDQQKMGTTAIIKVGQTYYENVNGELYYSYDKSLHIHTFSNAETGSVTKVFDPRGLSDQDISQLKKSYEKFLKASGGSKLKLFGDGSSVQYFESWSIGLTTITVWGTASEFYP